MSQDRHCIAGIHSVRTALRHSGSVSEVRYEARRHDRRLQAVLDDARRAGVLLMPSTRDELDRLVPGANHQGIVAFASVPSALGEEQILALLQGIQAPPLLLVLDGVEDPHNLGACLRAADGAGVQAVIAPRDRAVGLTPVAVKVASGAAESVPFIQVTNLARTLKQLQEAGIWIVGTSGDADQELFQADLQGPLALVMGAEEKGMRRLTREACDQLVRLPMRGVVESLNVAVATGICLYEAVRQRAARS